MSEKRYCEWCGLYTERDEMFWVECKFVCKFCEEDYREDGHFDFERREK